jgi:hypothetical protein
VGHAYSKFTLCRIEPQPNILAVIEVPTKGVAGRR